MTRMRERATWAIIWAAAVGMVSAAALTGAHRLLAPYQEANASERNIRDVLAALAIPGAQDAPPQVAADLYAAKVREEDRGGRKVWRYVEGGATQGWAISFSGRGYSAPIEGFVGLDPEMTHLRGMTVTYQAETPGLGGQVGSERFLAQFRGKRVDGLRLVRGRPASLDNEVDAITGATLTSNRFQTILDATLDEVRKMRSDRAR